MDLIEDLVIPQCCFCAKYAEECALTEVNSKTKLISSENVEFSSIVFDVVQRKVNVEIFHLFSFFTHNFIFFLDGK